jgi:hypothetical protein
MLMSATSLVASMIRSSRSISTSIPIYGTQSSPVSLARPFDNYIVEFLWRMQLEQHAAAAAAATSMHPNSATNGLDIKIHSLSNCVHNDQLVVVCCTLSKLS